MKTTYTVKNTYSTDTNPMTGSTHRTPEAALKAAAKCEGCGWIVLDSDGNGWDWNGNVGYISEPAPVATYTKLAGKTTTVKNRVVFCCDHKRG